MPQLFCGKLREREVYIMPDIKIAIAGVGNCASALVQGLYYYRNSKSKDTVGLMHPDLGGYQEFIEGRRER